MNTLTLRHSLGRLRWIALIEGVSYLVLVFLAMPLKYVWEQPVYVRVVGMAHGVLFVAFCLALAHVWLDRRWPFMRATWAFVSSLVPFGTFVLDRHLVREQETMEAPQRA